MSSLCPRSIASWKPIGYGLCLLVNLVSRVGYGACNDWEKLHGYENIGINDIAHDRFENTYVVGGFWIDDLSIGPLHFPVDPTTQTGTFLIKFDKDFNVVWGVTPQINGDGRMLEVDIDNDDNVVVGGDYFMADISFGCLTLNNSGRVDIFVVNYTKDGIPVWAISSTGNNDENIGELDVSANGDIVISATYVGDNDNISMAGKPISPFGGFDSFVASIHANGTMGWARGFGGTTDVMPDYIYGMVTDSQNNIVFTGMTESLEMMFDQFAVHSYNISENYFLVKLGPDGVTQWAKEEETHIYQWGFDCAVDADDNILVTGRFQGGDARFGSFTLHSQGSADIFIVKADPAGNPLYARSFGGSEYDVGAVVKVDHSGNIILSSYYYSKLITLDGFSSSKTETEGDAFVATLSPDLIVQCARFITGASEMFLWDVTIDAANNAWVIGENMFLTGETNFGTRFTITNTSTVYFIAVLGDNHLATVPPQGPPSDFSVSLGPDVLKCSNEKVTLTPGIRCGAQYLWSTGSQATTIEVTAPGPYWVDVTWQGQTHRATVTIANREALSVDLGNDQSICPGNAVAWNLVAYAGATYLWSDGTSSTTNTTNNAGTFWVKVSNSCETVKDSVQIKWLPIPSVNLGADQKICDGQQTTLQYTPQEDVTFRWSDGSASPIYVVTQSGTYSLTAANACGTAHDEIDVQITILGDLTIPNVVTANGDQKNDHFQLPDALHDYALKIYNRWGELVYDTPSYQNDWPQREFSTGIYFYTLQGECFPHLKGAVQLLH